MSTGNLGSLVLSPRREDSRDSGTSPSNSSSLITVIETDFPPISRSSYSGSSGSFANTTRRSVESNGSGAHHHQHQDSVESNSVVKSPSGESNGRKYPLPPKLPALDVSGVSAVSTGKGSESNGNQNCPSSPDFVVPTPPPPPTSSKPPPSLALNYDHHHTHSHPHSHHHHHSKKQKSSKSKFKFPKLKSSSYESSSPVAPEATQKNSTTVSETSSPKPSSPAKPEVGSKSDCPNYATATTAGTQQTHQASGCSLASAGGLKSKKLKTLIHPLDRSIVGIFTLTIFFTILALLTGFPIVLFLFALLPLVIALKKLFLCHFTDILHHTPLSSIDCFWLSAGHLTHAVLYVDKGLSLQQLRDVVSSRLLSKPELARFKSRLVYKGLCNTPYWKYEEEFDQIEEHVLEDEPIDSKRTLKLRLMKLMSASLPMDRPLWQIRYAVSTYSSQVILIVRVHQALSQSGLVSILTHYLSDSIPAQSQSKPRFGGVTLSINIFRAIIVGPLTFFLWLLWAFTRRHHNYLTRSKKIKSIHCVVMDLPKIVRIKQVTRSSLNDVLLSSIAGTLRAYLTSQTPITNPPDLTASIPIDIRPSSPIEASLVGVNYVLTTSPIPTNTEGAIPRLWEVRHLMEELKTSADTAVMYGAHYLLSRLLPRPLYRFIINLVNRNSSIYVSNIQGPEGVISIGSHRLMKAYYFISPPTYCSIVFNIFTINEKLYLSVSSRSKLIPDARKLTKLFRAQIELLHVLLSRRRVPGESKRNKRDRAIFLGPEAANHLQAAHAGLYHHQLATGGGGHISEDHSPVCAAQSADWTNRLHEIQDELNRLKEPYSMGEPGVEERYEALKEEFTELLYKMRRRKSIADYGHAHGNIMINIEDEDDDDENDGELRPPPRRFSVVSIGRRGSIVSSLPTSSRVTPPILSRRSMAATSPEPPSSPEVAFKIETEC